MINFKKYSSIENSFNREFMEKVVAEMPADLQYVVQEKVHGANTSFLCDGENVKFAKRTSMIEEGELFYNYLELLDEYRERVLSLYCRLKEQYPEMLSVSVFGEMFGGNYPHEDVKRIGRLSLIQKGVYYCPDHRFYGFDIYLHMADEGRFLPVDEANSLFETEGFFYAKSLFQGTLTECLQQSNRFQSRIAEWLGFPPIDDNICEGIVIRPVVPMYLRNGARVLIKSKNERFAEKKGAKNRNRLPSVKPEYSNEMKALLEELSLYVTENRLANVVSHIGEVSLPKDFGRLMGALSKDAFEDFLKEHQSDFLDLAKNEQKALTKELTGLATQIIKHVYMSQSYIPE